MPNDKNKHNNDDQVDSLDLDTDTEEIDKEEEGVEELPDDVKKALGLEEPDTNVKSKNNNTVAPVGDYEYIPEDMKETLNEIDNLM